MRFYSTFLSRHQYQFLPDFSKFLLANHLDDLVRVQFRLAHEVELPLLQHLKELPEVQVLEFTRNGLAELLEALAQNRIQDFIEASLQRWRTDQLDIIRKQELEAEDITLLHYIRGKSLRSFIPFYTSQVITSMELVDELDSFLMGVTTAATNTYIYLLKEEIAHHEKELLKAQAIAQIGSFEWNFITGKTNHSPEVYKIFEMEDKGLGMDAFMANVHPEDRTVLEQARVEAMKDGDFECEYRYVVNGKEKYIWSKGMVSRNADGKPEKFIGTIQDVTSRKTAEIDLLEKTHALERSNASLEQFAYAASHDLKEPIRKVQLFTDRLKDSLLPRMEQNEILLFEKLERSTNRMQLLVDDLLEYSHVSLRPKDREEINLNEKLSRVLDDLEVAIEEKQAQIKLGPLPVVKGYRRQLQQLFQNLIGNALKYSKEDIPPQIEISSRLVDGSEIGTGVSEKDRKKKFYLIEVKDNGIGFEPEEADKIFQVFQRLHGRMEYSGTGVGLAIARKVVENHNGYIRATGEPGKGATFSIYLPA